MSVKICGIGFLGILGGKFGSVSVWQETTVIDPIVGKFGVIHDNNHT